MPKTTAAKNFRKGDRVQFQLGTRWVDGRVTEDRGPIGVGGRRLYSVEFRADDASGPRRVELPADDLRRGPAPATAR
jgi:hypothetical protein